MKMYALFIPICLILTSSNLWSKNSRDLPKTLKLSISNSVPPYNMLAEKVDGLPGIQVEIVTKVMARIGQRVDWQTMTNNRAIQELGKGRLDGAVNISDFLTNGYYHTKGIVEFSNCLIGEIKADTKYKDFKSFYEALKANKKIVLTGFQGAATTFAEQLPGLSSLPNYHEVPHQKSLVATLLMGRTTFILSDFLVFRYYSQELKRSNKIRNRPDDFTCLAMIPSAPRVVSLKDENLQKKFDEEFQKMIDSGEHEKIMAKYQSFLSQFLDKGSFNEHFKLPQNESFALIYK